MKWPAGLGLLLLLAVGCGGGGDGGGGATISSQPLAGKIGGQAWTFATGETTEALSTSEQLWVDLYADTFDACVALGAPSNADVVTMMMPRTPGSYDVSLTLNATIYVPAPHQLRRDQRPSRRRQRHRDDDHRRAEHHLQRRQRRQRPVPGHDLPPLSSTNRRS